MKIILMIVFLILLLLVAVVDARTMEIPNGFVLAVLGLGVAAAFMVPEILLWERLIGILCVSLPLLLITLIIPDAFGGGDIKLMGAAGLFLGWKLTLFSLYIGVLLGGAYGAWLLLSKKKGRKEHFAFGPYLCFGMAVAALFGDSILGWYMNLF